MDAGCFSAVSFGEWILLAVEIVRSQIVINILDFKIFQKHLLKVSSHSEKRTQSNVLIFGILFKNKTFEFMAVIVSWYLPTSSSATPARWVQDQQDEYCHSFREVTLLVT